MLPMKMLDTLLFGNPGGPRGLVSGGKTDVYRVCKVIVYSL